MLLSLNSKLKLVLEYIIFLYYIFFKRILAVFLLCVIELCVFFFFLLFVDDIYAEFELLVGLGSVRLLGNCEKFSKFTKFDFCDSQYF